MTGDGLGDLIRRGRKAKGLSQGRLGTRLGVSAMTVSGWERGVTSPRTSGRLGDLARELDIDLEEIAASIFYDDPVQRAIMSQKRLSIEAREALVAIYKQLLDGRGDEQRPPE